MGRVADVLKTMEYGPAPESATPANHWLDAHGRRFGLLHWRRVHEAGEALRDRQPGHRAAAGAGHPGERGRRGCGRRPRHSAPSRLVGAPGHARARHLYAIARHVQKHSRLLAVLETLDNGKPIRETRDIDIPLVARHFYHHAGWAQLLERRCPATSRSASWARSSPGTSRC